MIHALVRLINTRAMYILIYLMGTLLPPQRRRQFTAPGTVAKPKLRVAL